MFPCFEIPRPLTAIRFRMKRPYSDVAARLDMVHRDHKGPILTVAGDEDQQISLVVVAYVTLVAPAALFESVKSTYFDLNLDRPAGFILHPQVKGTLMGGRLGAVAHLPDQRIHHLLRLV